MTTAEKLTKVAENTTKIYNAGYNKAKETFCAPINETGSIVQCCPLKSEPLIASVDSFGGTAQLTICGKNLYNKEKYPLSGDGYPHKTLGHLTYSGNYRRTDFIPVRYLRGHVITVNYAPTTAANAGMAFYYYLPDGTEDDCKAAFCGGGTGANTQVPGDAEYMCFCVGVANKDADIQIELGNVVTSYEPYVENIYTFVDPDCKSTELDQFDGINSIFVSEADFGDIVPVTVTGTSNPIVEHNRLKEYFDGLTQTLLVEPSSVL